MTADEPHPERHEPVAVSVIIAALNAERWIGQQLDALAAQELDRPWEVIVVDNGSTDATAAQVSRRQHLVPGLRLLTESEPGGGTARNTGARAASSDLLVFCDADDIVAPGWLTNLVLAVRPGAVTFGVHTPFYEGQPVPEPKPLPEDAALPRQPNGLPALIGGNCAMGRAELERAGWWPPLSEGPEDLQFAINATNAGLAFRFAPDAVILRRLPGLAREISRKFFSYGAATARMYERNPMLENRSVLRDLVAPNIWWAMRHLGLAVFRGPRRMLWSRRVAYSLGALVERARGRWNARRRGTQDRNTPAMP